MISKNLNSLQIKGLKKLGDTVIPGDHELPRFSKLGVEGEVDRMLDYMLPDDLSGLKVLLTLFAFFPRFMIAGIIDISERARGDGFIASQLRLLNTGLKGVPFTLYYSNLNKKSNIIHERMGWDSQIVSVPEGVDEMYQQTDEALNKPAFPATGEVANASDYARIAKSAHKELRHMDMATRLKYIGKLREVIIENRAEIISRIQKDNGKSRTDALVSEIFGVLDHLHWLEGHAKKALRDEKIGTPIALLGKKSRIFYEPLGTILIISPWNYPFYQAIVPITAAFVGGNSVIYKPSEETPLTGVIEDLLAKSGFASHWVQVAYGAGNLGKDLIDQRPDKIFFTGSVATGKKIMAQASQYLIPVELELGGKDPTIVFEDASLDRAVRGVLWGALTCTGQSCTSVEQVHVHESIYPQFRELLLKEVQKIRQGIDENGDGEIGLMTTDGQVRIVADHLDDALKKGASLIHGENWDKSSRAIPPLVLEGLTDDMLMVTEETFGPIIPLMSFNSEQDLVDKLNLSKYGLSASVWSADGQRCERVARSLHTGNVSINNVMLTEGNPGLPFGGVKDSGIGRYKGVQGLRSFCLQKSIIIDGHSNKCEVNWFPYTEKKYNAFDKMMVALFSGGIVNFIKFALTGIGLESYSDKIAKK